MTAIPLEFDELNVDLVPKWIEGGKDFNGFKKRRNKKIKKNLESNPFVKYNHAYGIPVFGTKSFTDDSMRRACYLVRFLFADNEHFRRHAFKRRMIIKGETGGYCCPPNVGNAALACSCNHDTPLYIVPAAHEMSHWYIQYVLPQMQKSKPTNLVLPTFINSTLWSYSRANDSLCKFQKKRKIQASVERVSQENKHGKVHEFLWNSQVQYWAEKRLRNEKEGVHVQQVGCGTITTQHYMDYTATESYLNLRSG